MTNTRLLVLSAAFCTIAAPAVAKDDAASAPATLTKCAVPYGTIAILDGDTQGWTKYNLGSPRELIGGMAAESNCFTLQGPAAGTPADFLLYAIAGDKEEVDRSVDIARTAVIEGALRSGLASQMVGRVPVVGGMMGMFGGLGGKKKTYAAALRVVSPANGQTIVSGSGEAKSSTVTFAGLGAGGGYATSKDGRMFAAAFAQAFNVLVAGGAALGAARHAGAPAPATLTTAVDTKMWDAPGGTTPLRGLRPATLLTPTGKRQGMFVEVRDSAGTIGWVSVEDLK